jgi:hypothetical protein
VARWFRWDLSVADLFVCRCLTSRGPGRWPGQSGKELQSHKLLFLLNVTGSSLEAPPCFRFHTALIEPDVQIYCIRLSEKTHAIAEAIACDAVCNF